jgi:NADH:ubiquinone oxidoreductase subunit 5 (subunit L)/multisubunit Na+/H+ antiporter MnhA subunit
VSAVGLAVVLHSKHPENQSVAVEIGRWLDSTGRNGLRVDWGLHADFTAAIWLAVVSGLAGITTWFSRSKFADASEARFAVATAFVLASTIGLVTSSGLVQMLTCWTAISLTTFVAVGCSSPRGTALQGMRRAVQAGLAGDLLLMLIVVVIGRTVGSDSFVDVTSTAGLARLGTENPALPRLIGCLLVLGILGRCGLFPCFGWHHAADAWDGRQCLLIYGIGHVPSAVWLLIKCQPILTSSEVPLGLMGGLGTLGAVVGAFVACGQAEPRRRLAYLLASQTGIMLAALGSGHDAAVATVAWHQCGLSLATLVLFIGVESLPTIGVCFGNKSRLQHLAVWCAALSVAGVFPCCGGWTQPGFAEFNAHPMSSHEITEIITDQRDDGADAMHPDNRSTSRMQTPEPPRWGWIIGLWLTQGLTAYAVAAAVNRGDKRCLKTQVWVAGAGPTGSPGSGVTGVSRSDPTPATPSTLSFQTMSIANTGSSSHPEPEVSGLQYDRAVAIGAMLLLIGGVGAWLLGIVAIPKTADQWTGFAIGQTVAIVGLIAGWRASSFAPSTDSHRWESLGRLSHERFYVDHWRHIVVHWPMTLVRGIAARIRIEYPGQGVFVRIAAWIGAHVESLHTAETEFYLATLLLGTMTLLLTLVLVA